MKFSLDVKWIKMIQQKNEQESVCEFVCRSATQRDSNLVGVHFARISGGIYPFDTVLWHIQSGNEIYRLSQCRKKLISTSIDRAFYIVCV